MMLRPGGYAISYDVDGHAHEIDTITCKHCNRVVMVHPKCRPEDLGGFCTVCAGHICDRCVGKGCDPFEEKLKRVEASYHARRSYGLVG